MYLRQTRSTPVGSRPRQVRPTRRLTSISNEPCNAATRSYGASERTVTAGTTTDDTMFRNFCSSAAGAFDT